MAPAKTEGDENRNANVQTSTCVAEAQDTSVCSTPEFIYQHNRRYDPVAVTLHWVIAFSIIIMIALGFFMGDLPFSLKIDAYIFHKSLGLTVLALSFFRLIWRFMNPPPALPDTMKPIEKLAANTAHWFLYFLMIAMPLSGWLMVSASKKTPTIFYWFAQVPHIPMPMGIDGKATARDFNQVHEYLAFIAIALVLLHAGAALKHHFIEKDTVLTRMLPKFLVRRKYA